MFNLAWKSFILVYSFWKNKFVFKLTFLTKIIIIWNIFFLIDDHGPLYILVLMYDDLFNSGSNWNQKDNIQIGWPPRQPKSVFVLYFKGLYSKKLIVPQKQQIFTREKKNNFPYVRGLLANLSTGTERSEFEYTHFLYKKLFIRNLYPSMKKLLKNKKLFRLHSNIQETF